MMVIDGKKIATALKETLRAHAAALPRPPKLAIVIVGTDPVIESFVRVKKRSGEAIGAVIEEFRYDASIEEHTLCAAVDEIAQLHDVDGVVIQLPLPPQLNAQVILDRVPPAKDVDMLSTAAIATFARGEAKIFPPVASAVQEILERHDVHVEGKEVLVLGHGRLVGKPVAILLRHNHAHVTVVDSAIADLHEHARESAIIVCGVGKPGLITPEMITPETILIDAGTSESGGKIVGDVDPLCEEKAALITPVPGGVGPIAVAMLFKNLVMLARMHTSIP